MSGNEDYFIALTDFLNKLFGEHLTPGNLISAKIDDTGPCVPALVNILHKLCCFETLCFRESKLECIKQFLASLQYNDRYFHSLPNDESCGNQELLLGLAWLIVELCLENYLINTIESCFFEFNPNPIILNIAIKNQYEEDKENLIGIGQQKLIDPRKVRPKSSQRLPAKEVLNETSLSESEQMNLILFLDGRVKRMFKTINSLYNMKDQLIKKIKQESVGLLKLQTLSLISLLTLMDVDYMTDLTKEVKRINELIYAYLFWKKHSGNFFLWMGLTNPGLSPYTKVLDLGYIEVTFGDLVGGINKRKVIVGKVLWSTKLDDSFPLSFGLMDKKQKTGIVTIYHTAPGKGVQIRDTVAIPDPHFTTVNFTYKDVNYTFPKIWMECPTTLIVNNKMMFRNFRGFSATTTQNYRAKL